MTDKSRGGNHQLDQPPDLLNHAQPVGGLYARPFQPVVKHRVLVGDQVKFGGMLHHLNADVAGVFVRQERVRIIDGASENAAQDGEAEFTRYQPPQPG